MQVKMLLLSLAVALVALPAAAEPDRAGERGGRHDDRRHRGWPAIVIEPNIVIGRDRGPNVDAPEFIMAELGQCAAAGVRLFVDCLRRNHGSIMIRRLEACVRSETIPDEPERVAACLPPAGLP